MKKIDVKSILEDCADELIALQEAYERINKKLSEAVVIGYTTSMKEIKSYELPHRHTGWTLQDLTEGLSRHKAEQLKYNESNPLFRQHGLICVDYHSIIKRKLPSKDNLN